jgi:hypothetical protein
MLLTGLLLMTCLFSLLSYTALDHLHRGDATYGELGLSTPIINQENAPQENLPIGQSYNSVVSVEISSSQMTSLCQVDIKVINMEILFWGVVLRSL